MPSQIIAASLFLLVVVLSASALSGVMGMHWVGLVISVVTSVLYGMFLGRSRQTGTTK